MFILKSGAKASTRKEEDEYHNQKATHVDIINYPGVVE
jgi:hypothetical protein